MSRRRSRAEASRGRERPGPAPRGIAIRPSPETPAALGSGPEGIAQKLIPLLLIGLGLAAYHNSFAAPFLLDDFYRIVDNPQIRRLWPPWEVVAHSPRPVVQLSLALNYALGGLSVWGYHALNLTVHLLAGLALFGVLRRMLESERLRPRYGRAAPWLAGAVALIWTVHPLQTESVTYIIQRGESLMGLFYLLTLYCGIRGAQSPHPRAWSSAAILACALGMGSKEVMVTAPLVTLLYDRLFLADSFTDIFRRRWGLYLGLAATWGLMGALLATGHVEEQTGLTVGLTPWNYAMAQFGVIVHYLRLAIWPYPLVFDYTWRLPGILSSLPWAAVVLALLAGTALAFRWLPWVGFWGAWFFLILAPTSSLLPIADLAFEHRMYLPLAAVVVLGVIGGHEALSLGLHRLRAPGDLRRWLEAGLVVAIVAALGSATLRRNEDYQSDFAMWSDTVAKRPDNPRAQNNLGIALEKRGKLDEAIARFAEAVRLKPDYAEAHRNLGLALAKQGRNQEAIAQYSQAIRLKPAFPEAYNNLGAALYVQGRYKEAIAQYSQAIRLKPAFPEAHQNLGLVLVEQGAINEAIAHFAEAVRLKPDYAKAHNNLGSLLYSQGQVKEAIAHFAEAVRLEPDSTDALNNLRAARARLKQPKATP